VNTSQLPQLLLAAACMQTIFFAGSLSWFTDGLPNLLLANSTSPMSSLPSLLGHLPRALLAAGSHTSSFTVGCFVAVFLRAALPTNITLTKKSIAATFACMSVMYFLVCFLWFVAIVPRLLGALGHFFPSVMQLKEDTKQFDIISTSDVDHSLVASGSHTLSWLIGILCLALSKSNFMTRRVLQKLIVFTTMFSVCTVGSKLQPSFIALMLATCAVVLLAMRKKSNVGTKLDIMTCVCVIVGLAASITKILPMNTEQKILETVHWWLGEAMTPNLPFCEEPFAMSPYLAQGASCLAHMPFVPAIILGLSGVSPELIPTLNIKDKVHGKEAKALKTILWLQFALQAYTGLLGHGLPNPRMVFNQEFSISTAFALLFFLVKFTTEDPNDMVSMKAGLALCLTPVLLYFTIGLMPLIFLSVFASVAIGTSVKGAFGRWTPAAEKVLLGVFIPSMLVLAVETTACDYLQGIAKNVPWHLLFDLLLWQVVCTAVDVCLITPVGKYLKPWSKEMEAKRAIVNGLAADTGVAAA
jgi:hypothetical protein